jgi:hypothetical protein
MRGQTAPRFWVAPTRVGTATWPVCSPALRAAPIAGRCGGQSTSPRSRRSASAAGADSSSSSPPMSRPGSRRSRPIAPPVPRIHTLPTGGGRRAVRASPGHRKSARGDGRFSLQSPVSLPVALLGEPTAERASPPRYPPPRGRKRESVRGNGRGGGGIPVRHPRYPPTCTPAGQRSVRADGTSCRGSRGGRCSPSPGRRRARRTDQPSPHPECRERRRRRGLRIPSACSSSPLIATSG